MIKEKNVHFFLVLFYIIAFSLAIFSLLGSGTQNTAESVIPGKQVSAKPNMLLGINIDSMLVVENVVRKNETLASIFSGYKIPDEILEKLSVGDNEGFDPGRIISGNSYFVLTPLNDKQELKYFIYQHDPVNFTVFDINGSFRVYTAKKEVSLERKTISGIINFSLYDALEQQNADPGLIAQLSRIFSCQIDFYRVKKGDYFRVIYEDSVVNNSSIGSPNVIAAEFNHNGKTFYAFKFGKGMNSEYFDENGNSLKSSFLKAPLDYVRISSRYNLNRFHPILKRVKPHLGTDYAAPEGTPIHSVGDGYVIAAGYTRGNGRYVKIKHNSIYTTQYLHMSGLAPGIKYGASVRQGQVIGYVGSTGLATGPHLCFRFWKNGIQVDPLKQKLPSSHSLVPELLAEFNYEKNKLIKELNNQSIADAGQNTTQASL